MDLLIEEGSRLHLVEVKSGETVAEDFFSALQGLGDAISKLYPELELSLRLVYGGTQGQTRTDLKVVPWDQLHNH